jgi:hypothetical protein
VLLGDLGDVLCPGFPVAALADLGDDAGVDAVAPALDVERQLLAEVLRRLRLAVVAAAAAGDVDDLDLVGPLLVQVDLVDHRVEPVVVGTQRLQHLPHDLEAFVVAQRLLRCHAGGDDDRQDDVAEVLAFGAAHHSPHRLHDVDLRAARGEEHHRVQRRHVDTLGQAAGVGQDAARVVAGLGAFLQPLQHRVALEGVHGAVDVLHLDP